jgi:hypothetical protein
LKEGRAAGLARNRQTPKAFFVRLRTIEALNLLFLQTNKQTIASPWRRSAGDG